ncbi:hypothetical protein [Brevibacillus borstelensis]|uniref:hypothetical protein n=1 Tax=Brevibacillus borstelensis TaxID=45462 RepID=UPI000B125680|nr:hypothetical protein [Brevibacillus borstelensis]
MTRIQRLRTCGNLIQLIETAKSKQASRIYRQQLERCLSRLKRKEQPQKTTA